MDFRATFGPWALITGASAGIGAAFARALASRGIAPILVARRRDRLEALAEELKASQGVAPLVVVQDLQADDALPSLREAVEDREVGLLVNNAGFGWHGSFLQQDLDNIRRMTRLNCEIPTLLARDWLPPMVERKRGGMVVLASVAGFLPAPWMAVYGATKAYDLMLGEALAVEMRPQGVRVLTCCPGHTATEFHDIAGIKGAVAGGAADPLAVAEQSLQRLARHSLAIPGFLNRFLAHSPRWLPRSWIARLSGRLLKHRSGAGR